MSTRLIKKITILLIPLLFSCASNQKKFDLTALPPKFSPPKPERVTLDNGMVVYLLPDKELPIISVTALLRIGAIYEPEGKTGLSLLTGRLLRTGGTAKYKSEELDEELDFLATRMSSSIGTESGSVSMDFLLENTGKSFDIFVDTLKNPSFEEVKFNIEKQKIKENLKRRYDKPDLLLNIEFFKILFKPDSIFAREMTEKTIDNITRDDLITFHKKYFKPNNIILGVSGDFEKEEMLERIKTLFGSWQKEEITFPDIPPVEIEYKASVNYIPKRLTQSRVLLGHLSLKNTDPDYFPLAVANDILGGQYFTSRLFKEVRTKKGLAYSINTDLSPGNISPGTFTASAQTKGGSTYEIITAILENIKKIREEYVTEEELKIAKESFLNSYIFNFSTTSQILLTQMSLEFFSLPPDYLETIKDNIEKVTREDIKRVTEKHLFPDKMTIIVIGDENSFDKPLNLLGEVNKIIIEPE